MGTLRRVRKVSCLSWKSGKKPKKVWEWVWVSGKRRAEEAGTAFAKSGGGKRLSALQDLTEASLLGISYIIKA